MVQSRGQLVALLAVASAACGGDSTGPTTIVPLCPTPTVVDLEVRTTRVIDARRESSCLQLAAGAADREYLVVTYSAAGQETDPGISGGFTVTTERTATAGAGASTAREAAAALLPLPGGLGATQLPGGLPADFHRRLRLGERDLARSGAIGLQSSALAMVRDVPVFGDKDTFNVCRTTACTGFNRVGATVRFVGRHGVIYLDDQMPAGADALTQGDLDQLGELFDDHLYPLDTTAFGQASDIDGDQRVGILITDAVNDLTPDCRDGRIVGYFFGGDLLQNYPGTNRREVFYALAPKPATANCNAVTRSSAMRLLPPVLIHELQHMISFNEHVLKRSGRDETLWVNEGLSHIAEELGQRQIPDARCPFSPTCFSQFASGNLSNAYQYLINPEGTHLIAPADGSGALSERGAAWLFLRWLADHTTSTDLGTATTRALVQTANTGDANVAAVGGASFATLLADWHFANWLDDLPGFPATGRLHYRTWNFRDVYRRNSPQVFERPYPLIPDSTNGASNRAGTLRAGSARYTRVVVPAGGTGVTVRVSGSTGSTRIPDVLEARMGVVRIR